MKTLFEAMKASHHIDEDGMILEDPNPGDGPNTGNGWHGWGVLSCLLHARNEVGSQEIHELFSKCYKDSSVDGFTGLIHRGPRKREELIAHDDLMGLCVASRYLDNGLTATLAYAYIKKSFGCYDNLNPGKWTPRSFLLRHPSVFPMLAASSMTGLGALERSMAIFRLTSNSLNSNPRGKVLDWMLYSVLSEEKSEGVIRARDQWRRGLFYLYPKGMRDVFSSYYGADHPFVEYGVGC